MPFAPVQARPFFFRKNCSTLGKIIRISSQNTIEMPLVLELASPALLVWRVDETEPYWEQRLLFSPAMQEEWARCHPSQRREWLATRWLAARLAGKNPPPYRKDPFGKPLGEDGEGQFSFSHTRGWAAVTRSESSVGVDIQTLEEKTLRISRKFMLPEEIDRAMENPRTHAACVHVHWGAREAVYKAYGQRGLDFRADMLLEPFRYDPSGGRIQILVRKEGREWAYRAHYLPLGDVMLAYAVAD
jgi:4'-phosphopantetheinyl transferase